MCDCDCKDFCENKVGYSKINLRTLYAPIWVTTQKAMNWLCFGRLLVFIYLLVGYIIGLSLSFQGGKFFVYLTYQTLTLNLTNAFLLLCRSLYLRKRIYDPIKGAGQEATWVEKFIWTVWQTAYPSAHIVTLIYWVLIYDPENSNIAGRYNHGPPLIHVYFEFFMSETPFKWTMLPICYIYYLLYIAVHLIFVFAKDEYIYEAVDPRETDDFFWFPVILVLLGSFFGIGKLLRYLLNKCLGNEEVINPHHSSGEDGDIELSTSDSSSRDTESS
ncbi:hypothetical protein M0812_22477 [Anaeramoeba flamelloides]|uniref:Uncharacterized protein n=1 Tax=Anaeramoeba flamelloides TaxID=1746091 RepID=A0AAV7YUP1_9EUKA|nr:hypothetical protein M0812_22477 [Anaeramoeba flamelloides]